MRRGLVAGAALLGLCLAAAGPAAAQGGFLGGGGGGGGNDGQVADMSVRINQLEGQMRGLNGQIEQLGFQIKQLQDQLARQQKDYEFRLQELENGAAKAPKPQKKSELPEDRSPLGAAPGGPPITSAERPGRGAPPASLGQMSGSDPIGGIIGAAGPMELGAPGTKPRVEAPAESQPVPGVDPRYATVSPTASPSDEYDAAYGYILNGEYDLAEKSFKTFLGNHPTDKRIGAAQFWLGETFYARARYKEAADSFLKSYTQFPDGPKAADSLLKLGLALNGLGEKKAACASWDELLNKYPKASKAVRDRAAAEKARGKC
ncbi:MAG: tol-pal system protein YbgF [Phyllobacteriaceae bacterium]|nr:tol-pal system protein YbgF [Phyllobacteriaceae bacterium]